MRSFHHFLFLMIVVTWECIFSLSLTLFSVCVTFSFSDTMFLSLSSTMMTFEDLIAAMSPVIFLLPAFA